MKGIFITGTGTGVGKTHIATLIAGELQQQGIHVIPRKPVESGCIKQGNELVPQDALALQQAAHYIGSLQQVCPFRYEPAISPQRAARLAGKTVSTAQVAEACIEEIDIDKDFLLVEGAGGFYSPLCEDGLNADLAQNLKLPLLLVAEDRLGCINDVLLCVEAIQKRQLTLAAIILNQSAATGTADMNNLNDLQGLLHYPLFSLSYQKQADSKNLPQNLIHQLLHPA